jgi:hypothetical protein
MATDQDSLHDSLTETHQHAYSSPYQHVEVPTQPVEASQTTAGQPASERVSSAPEPSPIMGPPPVSFPPGLSSIPSEVQTAIANASKPATGGAPITVAESADAFQQAEYGVEVGSGDSEQDDGYETDGSAASMSLASSARTFIFENGRRYHGFRAGAYSFPNDDREQDREDLKHAMFLKLFNKTLHLAPIPTSGSINVIDLGTGTGIWSIDCTYISGTGAGYVMQHADPMLQLPTCTLTPQYSGST